VILWQQVAAGKWLRLTVNFVFASDFYNYGQSTPQAVINDIFDHSEKYRNVKYMIGNMQSRNMAKGIAEVLHDNGIFVQRGIFTNFSGSVHGGETIPDVFQARDC
jgi:zinc/manganese transport system substrate-binding protein